MKNFTSACMYKSARQAIFQCEEVSLREARSFSG